MWKSLYNLSSSASAQPLSSPDNSAWTSSNFLKQMDECPSLFDTNYTTDQSPALPEVLPKTQNEMLTEEISNELNKAATSTTPPPTVESFTPEATRKADLAFDVSSWEAEPTTLQPKRKLSSLVQNAPSSSKKQKPTSTTATYAYINQFVMRNTAIQAKKVEAQRREVKQVRYI
jgi:hypothetical protein